MPLFWCFLCSVLFGRSACVCEMCSTWKPWWGEISALSPCPRHHSLCSEHLTNPFAHHAVCVTSLCCTRNPLRFMERLLLILAGFGSHPDAAESQGSAAGSHSCCSVGRCSSPWDLQRLCSIKARLLHSPGLQSWRCHTASSCSGCGQAALHWPLGVEPVISGVPWDGFSVDNSCLPVALPAGKQKGLLGDGERSFLSKALLTL